MSLRTCLTLRASMKGHGNPPNTPSLSIANFVNSALLVSPTPELLPLRPRLIRPLLLRQINFLDVQIDLSRMLLPGKLVRAEGQPASKDKTVNEAYDNCLKVLQFYKEIFNYISLD